jgi:superfamily I DNA/RNA helicase/mRNA-degrading endonuclease RelE of RelBE toxin-antitoxin system
MSTKWMTTMKPSFQTEWLALPLKESHQILEKIAMLTENPHPDGKVKKHLVHIDPKLHRLRSGHYRIFYTFDKQFISLLALRYRQEDTYDEDFDAELLGGLDAGLEINFDTITTTIHHIPVPIQSTVSRRQLPTSITQELLTNLHVPEEYHSRLMEINSEDDLMGCSDVSSLYIEQILEYMFPKSYEQLVQQPDLIVPEVEDLRRFKEGNLLGFLLKLSSEQEKAANWSLGGTGPTQVKGSPGTGKSTVALYRVRSLLENFGKTGEIAPRVLFVTYTNALVKSSDQLLRQLLGESISYVTVKTVDQVVYDILERAGMKNWRAADDGSLKGMLKRTFELLRQQEYEQYVKLLANLSEDYLLQEILQVIIVRKIGTLQEYLAANRRGRKYRLSDSQREAIWKVYEILLQLLGKTRQETWEQIRLKAEEVYTRTKNIQQYDAVIVDEAQDLDPSIMRLLVNLCKSMNRFFITADANQSIYRGSFSWADVHESLNFQGRRTIVLGTNYRSTRQISEAAQSYLANGALETEAVNSDHTYNGPLPTVHYVQEKEKEYDLLARFLFDAAHEIRQPFGSCAVLCPTKEACSTIADALIRRGLSAKFMMRQSTDLQYPGVKVLTIHSAKGLEFPIVALAGFKDSRFMKAYEETVDDGQDELLGRDRRIFFVGMTRTMRTLLVIVPAGTRSPLLTDFDPKYWRIQDELASTIQ